MTINCSSLYKEQIQRQIQKIQIFKISINGMKTWSINKIYKKYNLRVCLLNWKLYTLN